MNHGLEVLAGILPSNKENLLYAIDQLTPEHFKSTTEQKLYALIDHYFVATGGGILTAAALEDILDRSNVDDGKAVLYMQTYQSAAEKSITDYDFRYAVTALKELVEKEKTGEAIATAYEILERGASVDGVMREGFRDAKDFLYARLGDIDEMSGEGSNSSGDLKDEGEDILKSYLSAKEGKTTTGVLTGINTFDAATAGIAPGDLAIFAAFTGQGKSQFSVQTAWHASVVQGKNIFYATSETVRRQINLRIVARHSRLPQFELPKGLNTTDIKWGRLTAKEEDTLRAVLDDLKNNPAYGRIHTEQIPRGATLSFIEARMRKQQQSWPIEFCVIDYLNLLKPEGRRQTQREEASDILRDAKTLATSFDHGNSVPILSPWQIRQVSFEAALETGEYSETSLSDTSEAMKSADIVSTLLRLRDTPKRAKMQLLKIRDGAIPGAVSLDVDYRNAYLGEAVGYSGGYGAVEGFDAASTMGIG